MLLLSILDDKKPLQLKEKEKRSSTWGHSTNIHKFNMNQKYEYNIWRWMLMVPVIGLWLTSFSSLYSSSLITEEEGSIYPIEQQLSLFPINNFGHAELTSPAVCVQLAH